MQTFHHVSSLRNALSAHKKRDQTVGFVPTMGNLHDAHLALVKTAQTQCDIVVASIFVNRLQFGLNEDWDKYPRTVQEDAKKLSSIGCNYLFCPDEKEMYPNGMDAQTRVIVPTMADVLCGSSRPGHFDGVTTVVAKLFHIVQPDIAVFGKKDFQQLAIIRSMVEDLHFPVKIVAGDIVRERDGLAMSSRNTFMTADERPHANQLQKSLRWVCQKIQGGERDYVLLEREAKAQIAAAGFRPDYLSVCESRGLKPAAIDDKNISVLGAMYTQGARLIDNISIQLDEANMSASKIKDASFEDA